MGILRTVLLGAAAGVAIAYLRSDKGKELISNLSTQYSGEIDQISNTIKSKMGTLDTLIKNGKDILSKNMVV